MRLLFDRKLQLLTIIARSVTASGGNYYLLMEYDAANNAASYSKGPWPNGIYRNSTLVEIMDPDLYGKFGHYFLRFDDVPDRTGMGIHAGRENRKDKAGRTGHEYATLGCIRTTPHAMRFIKEYYPGTETAELWVL